MPTFLTLGLVFQLLVILCLGWPNLETPVIAISVYVLWYVSCARPSRNFTGCALCYPLLPWNTHTGFSNLDILGSLCCCWPCSQHPAEQWAWWVWMSFLFPDETYCSLALKKTRYGAGERDSWITFSPCMSFCKGDMDMSMRSAALLNMCFLMNKIQKQTNNNREPM